jgi:RNA polymerase sigma-70 factor (ECF subfamily)
MQRHEFNEESSVHGETRFRTPKVDQSPKVQDDDVGRREQHDDSDLELLARWRAGDTTVANILVGRHDAQLSAFLRYKINGQEAMDLKQEVWLELLKLAPRAMGHSFRAYLFGIARHVLFRYIKSNRPHAWDPLDESEFESSLSQSVVEAPQIDLRATLRRLPLDVQMLLELRYLHELSTSELATIYDVSIGTIKRRLANAHNLLKTEIPPK